MALSAAAMTCPQGYARDDLGMTQQADMITARARTVADSESRTLLKPLMASAYRRKYSNVPPTVGTKHDRQHTDLAGTAAKHPAAPLVRDEGAHARRVPDGTVTGEVSRPLADNTAGIATWLDARESSRGGDLTRKRSDPGMARGVYVSAPPAPSATVPAGQTAQVERHRPTYAKSRLTPEPNGHSGQRPRARREPARTGCGPSSARCGQSRRKYP
jgi:hypothetical protein